MLVSAGKYGSKSLVPWKGRGCESCHRPRDDYEGGAGLRGSEPRPGHMEALRRKAATAWAGQDRSCFWPPLLLGLCGGVLALRSLRQNAAGLLL